MPKITLIDAHAHAYRPQELELIHQRLIALDGQLEDSNPHKWRFRHEGTVESLLVNEKKAGIERFALLPISSKAHKARDLNKWVARMAHKYPEIIPFGTLLAESQSLEREVTELKQAGIKGVKIHSFLQRLVMDSPQTERLFEIIRDAKLPVIMDTMYLPGVARAKPHLVPLMKYAQPFSTDTRVLVRIARKFPELTIIAAHLGCLYGWELLDPLYDLDNLYFDLSYLPGLLPPEEVLKIIYQKGVNRIIFGTDAPWRHPQEAVKWFKQLGLSEHEQRLIGYQNFAGIIGD